MTINELIADSVKIQAPSYKGSVNYRPGEKAEKFIASKLPECHGITFGVRPGLPENIVMVDFLKHDTQLPFEMRAARAEHHSRQLDITGGRIQ